MVAAGTGIAPMRAFIAERAALLTATRAVRRPHNQESAALDNNDNIDDEEEEEEESLDLSTSDDDARERATGLPPAILYYGCRDARDALYADELAAWERRGIVRVRTAFSRPTSTTDGGKAATGDEIAEGRKAEYVSDAMWADRARIRTLWARGAKIYLCGSAARLGHSVAEACMRMHREFTGEDADAAQKWLEDAKADRYISDVY